MLKMVSNGKVILGIDKENVRRLKDNKPIFVNGKEIGIDHDIYIVYGETIKQVAEALGVSDRLEGH